MGKKRLMITLTDQTLELLEDLAKQRELTKSIIVKLALEKYAQQKGENTDNVIK